MNDWIHSCPAALKVLNIIEDLMIVLAAYFLFIGLIVLCAPLFKGYVSFAATLVKFNLYFDLLPNAIIVVILILKKLITISPKVMVIF